MTDGPNVEEMRQKVERRAEKWTEQFAGGGSGGGDVSSYFVLDCLQANELGDGILYATLHEGRFLFNKSSKEWLIWSGNFWRRDILDESLAAVENVVERYLEEARNLVSKISDANKEKNEALATNLQRQQQSIYKRVKRLRTNYGREQCLKMSHTNRVKSLSISGEEFDIKPMLLAVQNGVIDLRTGDLHPGRPEDYISKACNVEYLGIDYPCPVWDQMLVEIFRGDDQIISFLRRLFGYAITGLSVEHFFPIFWGRGRNGKGTIIEAIKCIMGPLATPIPTEMLLDQWRPRGSTGPSPDIMALHGLRLAFAQESDEGRKISPSRIKWLTGGDTLVGRNPYDKYPIEFQPTHTLLFSTNDRPHAPADDFAFWERAYLIPFELSFVDREPTNKYERRADKTLPEKLKEGSPGILAWIIRGCIEWQQEGFNPPEVITQATKEYRRDEDLLADFIEECCFQDPYAEIQASRLYAAFAVWFEENISKKVMSQKKFGRMMTKRFKREKSGTYKYFGLGLLSDEPQGL